MTDEERAAAEAAAAASQQTPEEIADAEKLAAEANKPIIYTAEELTALTPTDIDLERVDPAYRPIVENTIRDYKALQADHTRRAQELAELKKADIKETYFDDPQKDMVFKDYLKNPLKVLRDINSEIAKLESVIPDDGAEEYRNARRTIAQWQGIKDEFSAKKIEVSERSHKDKMDDARLLTELGAGAGSLLEYATKELGFSERDFKERPGLREAVKKAYKLANAEQSANNKQIKPVPHKAAAPSGGAGGGEHILDEDNPNLSTAERIEASRKRRSAAGFQ